MSSRRQFLRKAALVTPFATLSCAASPQLVRKQTNNPNLRTVNQLTKPPRLKPGDTVGIVSPAGAVYDAVDLEVAQEILAAMDLRAKVGDHVLDRRGYLAGRDADRAADLNTMFADDEVDAIMALRGGSGCGRILPLLDYDLIHKKPKILFGYSDITALLIACYTRSGLVTFHGPTGVSTWNRFSVDYFRRLLFDAEAVQMQNPVNLGNNLVQTADRVRTITPGTARGRLIGGNLTVLTSIIGSDYLPDWAGHILFLEDVGEDIYRIDRMITQLSLAGILQSLAGIIFGKCSRCSAGGGYGSLTLEEVLFDHFSPLGIPVWHGAMIGHISDKFTVPVGVLAEINAEEGTIQLLEPAVS